jgi:hypothetical protein
MDHLITMFCDIDDFCKRFEPAYQRLLLQTAPRHRMRSPALALSEILPLLVSFQRRTNFRIHPNRA